MEHWDYIMNQMNVTSFDWPDNMKTTFNWKHPFHYTAKPEAQGFNYIRGNACKVQFNNSLEQSAQACESL